MPPSGPHKTNTAAAPTVESSALDTFIDTFADRNDAAGRARVLDEIQAFWNERGLTAPTDLYHHLMQAGVKSGTISPERAQVFEQQFADSLRPEHTTGYWSKDRGALVDALTQKYATAHPVTQVEGDIGNLGGLNEATEKGARNLQNSDPAAFRETAARYGINPDNADAAVRLGRAQADRAIGTITGITRQELEGVGRVVASVRSGGDEFRLTVLPHEGVAEQQVREALDRAQTRVSAFADEAGLGEIPHLKAPTDAGKGGVGLGLERVEAQHLTPFEQRIALDAGIVQQKDARAAKRTKEGKLLGPDAVDTRTVDSALQTHAGERLPTEAPPLSTPRAKPGEPVPGDPPEESRRLAMRAQAEAANSGTPLTAAEERAVNGTHALTAKIDPVTHVHMFADMQREQLPHFLDRGYGDAKLVHVDFSNLGGANQLNTAVGDAVYARQAEVVKQALQDVRLPDGSTMEKFTDYMAAQGNGKFAVLLPANTPPEQMKALEAALRQRTQEASAEPLKLSEEAKAAAHDNIGRNDKLKAKYASGGPFGPDGEIRMQDIAGAKPVAGTEPPVHLRGVIVSVASTEGAIDPHAPLGRQMEPLEKTARDQYAAIAKAQAAQLQTQGGSHEHESQGRQSGSDGPPAAGESRPPGPDTGGVEGKSSGAQGTGRAGEGASQAATAEGRVAPSDNTHPEGLLGIVQRASRTAIAGQVAAIDTATHAGGHGTAEEEARKGTAEEPHGKGGHSKLATALAIGATGYALYKSGAANAATLKDAALTGGTVLAESLVPFVNTGVELTRGNYQAAGLSLAGDIVKPIGVAMGVGGIAFDLASREGVDPELVRMSMHDQFTKVNQIVQQLNADATQVTTNASADSLRLYDTIAQKAAANPKDKNLQALLELKHTADRAQQSVRAAQGSLASSTDAIGMSKADGEAALANFVLAADRYKATGQVPENFDGLRACGQLTKF